MLPTHFSLSPTLCTELPSLFFIISLPLSLLADDVFDFDFPIFSTKENKPKPSCQKFLNVTCPHQVILTNRGVIVRFLQTHKQLTSPTIHPHDDKMSVTPHWRGFSLSQWRQFRDQLLKLQSDGMFMLNKEWTNILQKLPPLTSKQDGMRIKRFHPYSTETKDQKLKNESSIKTSLANNSATLSTAADTFNKSDPAADPVIKTNSTVSAASSPVAVPPQAATPLVSEEPGISYLQVLSELNWRLTFGMSKSVEGSKAVAKAKWRTHEETITKSSINSRTRHVISAVISATSRDSKIKRLEGFLQHLYQYPESRSCAVKEGAVTVLLRQRQSTKDNEILAHVREALTLLGYVDPPRGHGIRVLSIDGGGIRGVLAIKLMMKLEELTGKPIYELFDYVCGVSTGAILAYSIFPHKRRLDEVLENYKELSKQVFNENVLSGTRRLMWYHAYYDTTKWENMLQKFIGSTKLIHTSRDPTCPKLSAVSTVVNKERGSAFVFRNYQLRHTIQSQYNGSSEHQLWEAVRASSSAPTYFREFQLGNFLHQDGGIMANNPCGIAIHEARLLWPGAPLQCVVSFGTGRCNPALAVNCDKEPPVPSTSSWSNKVSKILDSATDTEAIHTLLNDLMPGSKYYRFNPYLTEMLGMSEIRADKLSQLEMDAEMYYRRNEEKFQEAARTLLEPRTTSQRLGDWFSLQANILGLKANL